MFNEFLKEIKKLIKLHKIENAVGIKLTKIQRKVVLAPCTTYWGVRSGKTVCACIWILLHREAPIGFVPQYDKRPFPDEDLIRDNWIPDPDNRVARNAELHTYRTLMEFKHLCDQKDIQTCAVLPLGVQPRRPRRDIESEETK